MPRLAIALFTLLLTTAAVFAQLTLDKNFNAGVTDGEGAGYVSVVQPDGKILVGGDFQFVNSAAKSGLARLNPDGSFDPSFNAGGAGANGGVYEINLLSDGRILIAGAFTTYNGFAPGKIARLHSDGSLDTTFNPGGTGFPSGSVHSITEQSDGKFILSGQFLSYNGDDRFAVIRIQSDGSLDPSFTSPFTSFGQFVEQTAIQPGGKIVIGGSFGVSGYINVARLNTDGTLDMSFTPFMGGDVYALAIDPNNQILVGGFFQLNNGAVHSMARLNPDGSVDPSFISPFAAGTTVEYFVIKEDGKLLVAGTFADAVVGFARSAVRQLNSDGTNDPSFSSPEADDGGYHVTRLGNDQIILTGFFDNIQTPGTGHQNIVRLNPNGTVDETFAAALSSSGGVLSMLTQSDGKVLVAGDFYRGNGLPHRSVVRFNPDATVDNSFSSGWGFYPMLSAALIASTAVTLRIAQQLDGKILIARAYRFDSYDEHSPSRDFLRINVDGSPDTSFVPTGLHANAITRDVLVQPDGKIVVVGRTLGVSTAPLAYSLVVRLNPDGTIDPSFTRGTTNNPGFSAVKVLRQPDGKLIVVGDFINYLGSPRNGVVRLNEDGTVDNSFNSNGTFQPVSLALQTDGKILVGGVLIGGNGYVVRWHSNGTVDSSFNTGSGPNGLVRAISVQPNGKILIAGSFTSYDGASTNKLARLNQDGSLDTTVTSGLDSNPANLVSSINPTDDGQILIGGIFSSYGGIPRNNIAKLRIDDPTGAIFDYDGDGKTDFSVFRPSSGAWYLQRSTAGFQGLQFGADGDKLTPADYDGDGKTDIAIYRPSTGIWYILNSSNGTVSYPVFGIAEDVPAPGDYDGDGKADWTVFRPSQGTWYRTNSSNGTTFGMQFGANGDVPTVGDFDGDGKNDLGIFRPSVGDWYNIRSSNGSVFGERFGQTGDRIAPADYDGDGRTDIAIYRPSTGLWVVRKSATATYSYEVFGLPADVPISGDYDGDGKADIGVWRPSDGTWYIKRSDNSQFIVFPWGQNGDKPTPAAYGN